MDPKARRTTMPVLVLGDGGEDVLVAIAGTPANACVVLGRIQGFEHHVALYRFDAKTDDGTRSFWDHLPLSRWIIVASTGPRSDGRAWTRLFDPLLRVIDAQRQDLVVGLVGDNDVRRAWIAYGARPPLVVSLDPQVVIKGLWRHFVASL